MFCFFSFHLCLFLSLCWYKHLNVLPAPPGINKGLSYLVKMPSTSWSKRHTTAPPASLLYHCLPQNQSLMFPCCRGCVVCLRGNSYQTQQPFLFDLNLFCIALFPFTGSPWSLSLVSPPLYLHINNVFRPVATEGTSIFSCEGIWALNTWSEISINHGCG